MTDTAVAETRSDQGQPADRPVLHRGRRARRHAGGAPRQDRLQPGLGLGRLHSLLRRAGARIQDHDDHRRRCPDQLFIWRIDRAGASAVLDLPNSKIGKVEVPLRPFFGTIGTAPGGKECISSLVPGTHGANMDFNEVVEGVTMYFPVYEKGALFMLGDGHAAQGDGEIDGAAIETSFNVRFTVNLIKGKKIGWPRLINDKVHHVDRQHPAADRCAAARLLRHDQLAGRGLRLRQDTRRCSCWARPRRSRSPTWSTRSTRWPASSTRSTCQVERRRK